MMPLRQYWSFPFGRVLSFRCGMSSLVAMALLGCFTQFYTLFLRSPITTLQVTPKSQFNSDVYHSPKVLGLDFDKMERSFKVYIYPDGDPKTYFRKLERMDHKYASEIIFLNNIREEQFRTKQPEQAHLFFIPISCYDMHQKGLKSKDMKMEVQDYVEHLIHEYPHWNRTLGTDHFFLTCDNIGVKATEWVPLLKKNSIRVVCSPSFDVESRFIPHKDVPLPQVRQPFFSQAGGNDIADRKIIGFWGGSDNSEIREELELEWERDKEFYIPKKHINVRNFQYDKWFRRSKFCICELASKVNTICLADSIHYGCVPVILSNNSYLPFNDILDWKKFSVIVNKRDHGLLKPILKKISDKEFRSLHYNLMKVQKHFEWHIPHKKYDAFHMVMYDLWLRRHTVKY